ncbi:MAG TPA: hypothetical protein VM511_01990 [Luteolibacter sp.]|nr:hypothetical protein [Luteolibacter sp.]
MNIVSKFQSVIGRIMHGIPAAASIAVLCFPMTSCMSLMAKKHSYSADASSPAVKLNGADIRLQLNPQGTDGGSYAVSAMVVAAAVTTLDGPFKWRIEATGQPNRHESIVVHRLRTRTTVTKRDEWYPVQYLNKRADFRRRSGSGDQWRAVFEIPGLLKVKPREDGALEVLADITVRADGKNERRTVKFRLNPAEGRRDEFIFLPTEIVKSIGRPMSDWEETGWD